MNKYTVIGFYQDTGQIFSHHVKANDSQHSFYVVAKEFPDANFVSSLKGHLTETQDNIEFPGESIVDAETVLFQKEVFLKGNIEPESLIRG